MVGQTLSIIKTIITILILTTNVCCYALDFEVVSGQYIQENYVAQSKQTLSSSGDFTVVKELGIHWDNKLPIAYQTIMDDQQVLQIYANGQRQIVSDNNNPYFSTVANMIKSLFVLDDEALNIYFNKTILAENKYRYNVKDKNIKKFLEYVDIDMGSRGYISNMKIFYANKNTTEYRLDVKNISSTISVTQKKYFEK